MNRKLWLTSIKVVPGLENDEEVVISSGLNVKDKIYTSTPKDVEVISFFGN